MIFFIMDKKRTLMVVHKFLEFNFKDLLPLTLVGCDDATWILHNILTFVHLIAFNFMRN